MFWSFFGACVLYLNLFFFILFIFYFDYLTKLTLTILIYFQPIEKGKLKRVHYVSNLSTALKFLESKKVSSLIIQSYKFSFSDQLNDLFFASYK